MENNRNNVPSTFQEWSSFRRILNEGRYSEKPKTPEPQEKLIQHLQQKLAK